MRSTKKVSLGQDLRLLFLFNANGTPIVVLFLLNANGTPIKSIIRA